MTCMILGIQHRKLNCSRRLNWEKSGLRDEGFNCKLGHFLKLIYTIAHINFFSSSPQNYSVWEFRYEWKSGLCDDRANLQLGPSLVLICKVQLTSYRYNIVLLEISTRIEDGFDRQIRALSETHFRILISGNIAAFCFQGISGMRGI